MPPALPVTPCGLAGEERDHTGSPSRGSRDLPVAIRRWVFSRLMVRVTPTSSDTRRRQESEPSAQHRADCGEPGAGDKSRSEKCFQAR